MSGLESGLIRGLEGVVAATTRLCVSTAPTGGWPTRATTSRISRPRLFEEVVWLLWHGELPRAAELAAFRQELAAAPAVEVAGPQALPKTTHPR